MNRQFKNVQMFEDLQSHHVPFPALFAQLPKRARLPARSKRASRMQRAQDSQGRAPARRRQGSSVANGHHSSSTVSSSGLGTMGNHGKTRMLMKVYRCSMPLWISTETPDFFVEETCWMFSCRRGEDIWQVREPWWLLAEPGRWGTGAAFGIPTL